MNKMARREAGLSSGRARRRATAQRDARIIQAIQAGQSMRSVARAHGLTRQAVRHILRRDAPLWAGRV